MLATLLYVNPAGRARMRKKIHKSCMFHNYHFHKSFGPLSVWQTEHEFHSEKRQNFQLSSELSVIVSSDLQFYHGF